MRILVTGANGLLGEKLTMLAFKQGFEVCRTALNITVDATNYVRLNITNKSAVFSLCRAFKPNAIVNLAALTDVDLCEREKDAALDINANAAGYLAEAANIVGAHMVQVSTDYVFDGERGMYSEDDEPNPIDHYGYSKLLGERKVMSATKSYCIARTSVIFGWGREHRPNFAIWVLNCLRAGKKFTVVTDQYASPTLNINLAEMIIEIIERKLQGIYHTAGRDRINRYNMAIKIAEIFNLEPTLILPVTSSSINWFAKRPNDSSLKIDKILKELNVKPMHIDKAIIKMKRTERRNNGVSQ